MEGDYNLAGYTTISNQELDSIISAYLANHPNDGERMVIGHLRSSEIFIQRSRVRDSIHRVDPSGVAERRRTTIKRRVYHVDYPNEVWHMDGNHKAIRWKFVIHGATDGFSRTIVMMKCSSDNRAATVLQHFLSATATYGLPHKIRTDGGGENVDVWQHMIQRRGSPSCVLVGSSVHNTRIERLWRDVRKSVIEPLRVAFTTLEEEGILDPDNDVDIYCLHQALKGRINDRLTEFAHSWNNHPLRSEGNFTPLQLFHSCDHPSDFSDDDSEDTANAQEPSVIDHVEVPSLRFNPCVLLTTQVQAMLLTHSHLNDRELYRLIAASVGTHIRSMNDDCCSCD
jgi:hypothetical protein